MLGFLASKPAKVLTGFLILQAVLFYSLSRTEPARPTTPLSVFPANVGDWKLSQEGVVEKEVLDVLKADDTLTRWYANPSAGHVASLFIAYFSTQRNGKAPHSPKNCLPGSGWIQTLNDQLPVTVPGRAEPIEVQRYVVARGNDRSVVLYWYHSAYHAVGNEYKAKMYTVLDSIRYNRSDTALVRVIIPLQRDADEDAVTKVAVNFIQSFYSNLRPYFQV